MSTKDIEAQLNDVKQIMHSNILKVTTNIGKLDEVTLKSEELKKSSKLFSRTASQLKCMMLKRNWKFATGIGGILLLILFAILAIYYI